MRVPKSMSVSLAAAPSDQTLLGALTSPDTTSLAKPYVPLSVRSGK